MRQPFVSIILPVRNEEKHITSCLQSIAAQDYPGELMELLVIDGLSDDSTLEKVAEFDSTYDGTDIQVYTNRYKTVPHALNLGISKAKGDIILRFDGHALMEPDYVSNCVKSLEQTEADNVGGPALNSSDGSVIGRAIELSHYSPFGLGGGAFRTGSFEGLADTVTFGCFPKEVFSQYGLYDIRLDRNQDIELNWRIRKGLVLNPEQKIRNSDAGPGKIYLTPKIKSRYRCRSTLGGLWKQNFSNGQWVVYTKWIAPYALSLRHFVPLLFVSSLFLMAFIAAFSRSQTTAGVQMLAGIKKALGMKPPIWPDLFNLNRWGFRLLALRLLLLELTVYFLTMLAATVHASKTGWQQSERFRRFEKVERSDAENRGQQPLTPNFQARISSLLLLPLVFMTLHFSYGLGSLWGMVTLPFRRKK